MKFLVGVRGARVIYFSKSERKRSMRISKIFLVTTFTILLPGLTFAQNNPKEYLQKGIEYERVGKISAATEEYKKAIDLDPNYSDALFNLGIIYLRKKQWSDAIGLLKRVVDLGPSDGGAYYNLAVASFALGKIPLAVEYNNKSLKLGYPGTIEFRNWLEPYVYKESDFEYIPTLAPQKDKVIIKIKGNPQGDKVLISGTLAKLEILEGVYREGMFKSVIVDFVQREDESESGIEKWTVIGSDNSKNQYMVKFSRNHEIGGTDILISETVKSPEP